jgi:Sec-independent protein translocase protein TatA
MEFLGVGPLELLLIVVLILIIFTPGDLAKGGRTFGRFLNRMYRSDTYKTFHQVSNELQNLPSRLAREAQLDDLKDIERQLKSPLAPPAVKSGEDLPDMPNEEEDK